MDETTAAPKKQKAQKPKSDRQKQKSKPDKPAPTPTPPELPVVTPEPPELTLSALQLELTSLKEVVLAHAQQIADLQNRLSRKRSPAHNGKVQIKDKTTGNVYPSKNNTYQSLLKAGELKDLVDKGIFGPEPEKNNFGWFALVRALPDRFEEVKTEIETK